MQGGRRQVIDAHCHLQDPRLRSSISKVFERAAAYGVTHIATCSCNEAEWAEYETIQWPDRDVAAVLPAFGLHPWYAGDASPSSYLMSLRRILGVFPRSMVSLVSERAFVDQLHLAQELQRPVVIHCVGAHGRVLEQLQSVRVPHVVLHSFSGPLEMVRAFGKLPFPVYFSFTAKQCLAPSEKQQAILAAVPDHRILLETDAPDQRPTDEALADHAVGAIPWNEPAVVSLAVDSVAVCRSTSPDDMARRVRANAQAAFQLVDAE
ncbi:hypothetical protein Ae201684P_002844 [Aphanomyces euteiches]|nr:hypothetical protein Ae201684P_002844 [Aphanomyces euteiches]